MFNESNDGETLQLCMQSFPFVCAGQAQAWRGITIIPPPSRGSVLRAQSVASKDKRASSMRFAVVAKSCQASSPEFVVFA
jgi:hypothetical protein